MIYVINYDGEAMKEHEILCELNVKVFGLCTLNSAYVRTTVVCIKTRKLVLDNKMLGKSIRKFLYPLPAI